MDLYMCLCALLSLHGGVYLLYTPVTVLGFVRGSMQMVSQHSVLKMPRAHQCWIVAWIVFSLLSTYVSISAKEKSPFCWAHWTRKKPYLSDAAVPAWPRRTVATVSHKVIFKVVNSKLHWNMYEQDQSRGRKKRNIHLNKWFPWPLNLH